MSLYSQLSRQHQHPGPERAKAPLRTNQGSYRPVPRYQSPSRPAPRRAAPSRVLSRPSGSRENRPNATRQTPQEIRQARNELFQRRLLALHMLTGPPPSPDRTTGRELAGFASSAFTGKGPIGDASNGFYPDALGAKRAGYGTQAGNPRQQALAEKVARYSASQPVRDLEMALSQSPVGTVAGDVVANRTWAKLAPLFQRNPGKPPEVKFGSTPSGTGGFAKDGKVTVNTDSLASLFASPRGRESLAGLLAHEFAHTQQGKASDWTPSTNKARKGVAYSPKLEGGADAFRAAVAPLLGYRAGQPSSSTDYGRAQQAFMRGARVNLPKALIQQFPRVRKRLTP